jgi:hypothetical protein
VIALGSSVATTGFAQTSPAGRPFAVRDSIEMTRVIRSTEGDPSVGDVAYFSPRRDWFVIHTRRGDIARDVNVDSLWLYRSDEVQRYVAASTSVRPESRVVFSIDTTAAEGISDIRWLDDTRIAFIASAGGQSRGVYVLDSEAGSPRLVSHAEGDVVAFAIAGDRLVYLAAHSDQIVDAVSVYQRSLLDLLRLGSQGAHKSLDLVEESLSTAELWRIQSYDRPADSYFNRIWMDPTGKYVVILEPAIQAVPSWSVYPVSHSVPSHYGVELNSGTGAEDLTLKTRYLLVDLTHRQMHPLLDAPNAFLTFNATPIEVFWSADGHRSWCPTRFCR